MSWATKRDQRLAKLRARLDAKRPVPQAEPSIVLGLLVVADVERVPVVSLPPVAHVARVRPSLAPRRAPAAPVHVDPDSIAARVYRPCPPGFDLGLWLDLLAEEA